MLRSKWFFEICRPTLSNGLIYCFLQMDPLFQKLSTTFDEGSTSSLLLNHLGRRDDLCETLFDSKTVQFIHAPVDYSICGTSDIVDSSGK